MKPQPWTVTDHSETPPLVYRVEAVTGFDAWFASSKDRGPSGLCTVVDSDGNADPHFGFGLDGRGDQ